MFCRPTPGLCQVWWSRCVTQAPHCMASPRVALHVLSKITGTLAFPQTLVPPPTPSAAHLRRACRPQQGATAGQRALLVTLSCLPLTHHPPAGALAHSTTPAGLLTRPRPASSPHLTRGPSRDTELPASDTPPTCRRACPQHETHRCACLQNCSSPGLQACKPVSPETRWQAAAGVCRPENCGNNALLPLTNHCLRACLTVAL